MHAPKPIPAHLESEVSGVRSCLLNPCLRLGKTQDVTPMPPRIVVGYLFAALWFYRIDLAEDELIERGLKRTNIAPLSTITDLRMETGWAGQRWLWAPTLRPFRRLAIYYTVDSKHLHIDISLNHFSGGDVRELLDSILRFRPDLSIPRLSRSRLFR